GVRTRVQRRGQEASAALRARDRPPLASPAASYQRRDERAGREQSPETGDQRNEERERRGRPVRGGQRRRRRVHRGEAARGAEQESPLKIIFQRRVDLEGGGSVLRRPRVARGRIAAGD